MLFGVAGVLIVLIAVGMLARARLQAMLISAVPTMPALSMLPSPAPVPTPQIITGPAVVRKVQALGRLEASRYVVETVVEAKHPDGYITRGEKVILIAHGEVIAGFDFSKLSFSNVDISTDGKAVTVTLPATEILSHHLVEDKTRVYSRDSGKVLGFINKDADPNIESEARQAGDLKILQQACEDGIMEHAAQDGKQAVQQLLTTLGFTDIQVNIASETTSSCFPAAAQTS